MGTFPALSVMVVEDHGFQRRMALRLLGELGVDAPLEAADGLQALRQLEAMGVPPDVVMVDLDLPGMDGIEFIGHVARRRLARSVLLFSALDPALLNTVQAMTQAYGLHVLGGVEKPLSADKLRDLLRRYSDAAPADDADRPPDGVTPAAVAAALEAGEIVAWFQPQVELLNGKPVGVEVLARWLRPDGEVVEPTHFVPLLEAAGLGDRLTERMLDEGCRWKQAWDRQGLRLHVSVNVPTATVAQAAAADRLLEIVRSHGVDPAEIVFELTESSLLEHAADSLGVLARLRLKGFGLSIDDFGTGYSSLAQLSHIPFTELKVDRGFVSGAHGHARKRAVIETSLELARKLGLHTVAEGIETVEEWQLLAALGCDMGQGYLIAHAVPPEALVATLARWRSPQS